MAEPLRRSGRERKRNSRYSPEPLEAAELEDLEPQSEDSNVSSFEHPENEDGEEEDDLLVASEDDLFAQDEDDEEPGEEPDDSDDYLASLDIITIARSTWTGLQGTGQTKSQTKRAVPAKKRSAGFRDDGVRSRGILLNASVMSKEVTVSELAGYDPVLTHKMRVERSKYGGTITLPFREGVGHGQSGLDYPEVYDEEVRDSERQSYLSWYGENEGWKIMAKAQSTSSLEIESRDPYIPTNLPAQDILLGPYNGQHHIVLPNHDSISVNEGWRTAIANAADFEEYNKGASDRPAWILNLGLRILALDWAPNRLGDYQFLAVSTDQVRPDYIPRVSALEAEEPFKAAVQIWAFRTKVDEDGMTMMDLSQKPKLVHVIGAEWGTIRRLSWCPAGITIEENSKSVGALAMVTSDGYIRVVDVCVDFTSSNPYSGYHFYFTSQLIRDHSEI